MLILTRTQVTTTMSTVYTTLEYECRHEKKGTGLILVPKEWCINETKKATRYVHALPICIEYTHIHIYIFGT